MSETKVANEALVLKLGEAIVKMWSNLPHDVQQTLFEQVVVCHGEQLRQELAVFLHDRHARTADAFKTKAMTEPDSLGG